MLNLTTLLLGCATEQKSFKVICPPLTRYTPEFRSKLATTLEQAGKDQAEIQQIVGDYMKLRDACRSLKD
jgi:F0F1-type ATP synthase membrane subunit b/b'